MTRPKIDLTFLETLPIIKTFLEDDCRLPKKKIRRYLLDLAVVYPYIINKYGSFEAFLPIPPNKKSSFFMDFVETEYKIRIKRFPHRNYVNTRNRVLQIMWDLQGFLGYLGVNLKANNKILELQFPVTDFQPAIHVLDLLHLSDEMPGEGRRRLKLLFWTTWNPVDMVKLCLNDFKHLNSEYGEFFWVNKRREKTFKKKVIYLNLFEPSYYNELERYCIRNDINSNTPIFSRLVDKEENMRVPLATCTFRAYFRYWARRTGLNELVSPKNIRALGITQLKNAIKDNDLVDLWSQHKVGTVPTHYIKDSIQKYIELMPQIKKAVGIETVSSLTEQVKVLKDDIESKLDIHALEIEKLKEKHSTPVQEAAREAAQGAVKELISLMKKELKSEE
jgi:hypothetical protein